MHSLSRGCASVRCLLIGGNTLRSYPQLLIVSSNRSLVRNAFLASFCTQTFSPNRGKHIRQKREERNRSAPDDCLAFFFLCLPRRRTMGDNKEYKLVRCDPSRVTSSEHVHATFSHARVFLVHLFLFVFIIIIEMVVTSDGFVCLTLFVVVVYGLLGGTWLWGCW